MSSCRTDKHEGFKMLCQGRIREEEGFVSSGA